MELNVPDAGSNVGKAIEQITNDYEANKVTAIFFVYATDVGLVHMNTGNPMSMPFVNLAASTYANAFLDGIENSILDNDSDDDD